MTASLDSRLVTTLTGEAWNRKIRNVAAREIAAARTADSGPVQTDLVPILKQGVVGRYDSRRAELLRVVAEATGCAARIASEGYEYRGRRRRYFVRIVGHAGDIDLATRLFEELMAFALQHMQEITGEDVLRRRRTFLQDFLDKLAFRLADVGQAPSLAAALSRNHADAAVAESQMGAFLSRE